MDQEIMRRALTGIFLALALAAQTKKPLPKPDKKDVIYIVHAATLVQTEIARPIPKDTGDSTTWSIPGESSLAKTPLALPIFTIDAAALAPEKLQLYQFTVNGSRRELTLKKKGPSETDPILITVSNIAGTLYRIEVVNEVPNGEYGLTIPGSNQFFCFSVF
jgi:hypothetical protein